MSEEEMKLEENFEHEVIDRLHCLDYEDFNTDKLDDSYIVAMLRARNIILDLYNKEKEKNKELMLDKKAFTDNYGNMILKIAELEKENKEIRQWKYVIDTYADLEKLKELDLIKIEGKEYISKDKIKDKIKEYQELVNEFEEYWSKDPRKFTKEKCTDYYKIEVLKELLEE